MNPRRVVADQVLSGYRMVRNFALARDMLAELLGADDDVTIVGWSCGVDTIMIDLLTALRHYADKRALDWDEIVDWANGHHRIEAGVGRAWELPDSALTKWVDWGNPYLKSDDGRIIVMPAWFEDVEWIIEQGGTELPTPPELGQIPRHG